MAAIEVSRLTKRFGGVLAVDDLSFQVESGTVVGFLGPNGAGKTTTLRALLGLVAPDGGSATIQGRRYAELAEPLRRVGASLEASACHPGRTARQNTVAELEYLRDTGYPFVLQRLNRMDVMLLVFSGRSPENARRADHVPRSSRRTVNTASAVRADTSMQTTTSTYASARVDP